MREKLIPKEEKLLRKLNFKSEIELAIREIWLKQEPPKSKFTFWSLLSLISPLLIICLLLNLPVFHLNLNGLANLAVVIVWLCEIIFQMLLYPILVVLLACVSNEFDFDKVLTFETLATYKKIGFVKKLYLILEFVSLFVLLAMNGYIFTSIFFCLASFLSLAFRSFYRSKVEEVLRQLLLIPLNS